MKTNITSTLFPYEQLLSITQKVFLSMGCPEPDAALAAKVLVQADLRGIESHGVARLSGYVRLWEAGRIIGNPNIRIIHETPSTATVDGGAGLGLVVAPKSMEIAIEKATKVGTGWVSVQNSNHFGIAGYHAMMALEQDMIGIAMTNASALVAPTYGIERMLGTNPIAVAVPAGEEQPFVADFATTTAANGKLEISQRTGVDIPIGWAQTNDGFTTNDAHILKKGGALLPLGTDKEHGSHKGYALGSIVDIFCGVLSGANYGPWVPPFPAYVPMPQNMPGKGIGHFLGAMRIDAFRPADEFKHEMDNWILRFRTSKPAEGQKAVLVHGQPEREKEALHLKEGIEVIDPVVEDLKGVANRFGIGF